MDDAAMFQQEEPTIRYMVIGHTPGYLSEDDDPGVYDDYDTAVAALNDEVARYTEGDEEHVLRVEVGLASSDNLAAVMIHDDSRTHDLGYVIEVLIDRGDE